MAKGDAQVLGGGRVLAIEQLDLPELLPRACFPLQLRELVGVGEVLEVLVVAAGGPEPVAGPATSNGGREGEGGSTPCNENNKLFFVIPSPHAEG